MLKKIQELFLTQLVGRKWEHYVFADGLLETFFCMVCVESVNTSCLWNSTWFFVVNIPI